MVLRRIKTQMCYKTFCQKLLYPPTKLDRLIKPKVDFFQVIDLGEDIGVPDDFTEQVA